MHLYSAILLKQRDMFLMGGVTITTNCDEAVTAVLGDTRVSTGKNRMILVFSIGSRDVCHNSQL